MDGGPHNPWAGFFDGDPGSTTGGNENVDSWSYTYFKWQAYGGDPAGSRGRLYIDQTTYENSPLERTSAWYPAGGYRAENAGNFVGLSDYGAFWSCNGSGTNASYLRIRVGDVYQTNSFFRTMANSVRCLSK